MAMIVLLWSRATRDLLKSFGWGIAALHRLMRDEVAILAARPIESSSTRAREVGCRAPTAAKSNGSTTPLSMRIGDLRSARTRTRAGGQGHRCARPLGRGPHRGRRFIARAIAPGIGIMKAPARVPV